jgi:hypothetical protein
MPPRSASNRSNPCVAPPIAPYPIMASRALNIPDLYRFSMRSWQACLVTARHFPRSVPHVRAMDIPLRGTSFVLEALEASGLPEVLVVRGDPPRDLTHNVFPTPTVEAIRRIKRELPSLKVYAEPTPIDKVWWRNVSTSRKSSTPERMASLPNRSSTHVS